MGNELVNIDTVKDKIRDRIQVEFISLIPKEAWDALVTKEINWFMTDKDNYYRSTNSAISPLRVLVRQELEKQFGEQIKKKLQEMGTCSWGANGQPEASKAVKEMVKKIAPELWEIAVAGVVQRAIEGFRNQLSQSGY